MCYSLFNMTSHTFNPLATILNQNKLVGSNYVDWKWNLDIVLTASGYKYVLTMVPLDEPGPDAPQDKKDHYAKWTKDDEMARCYIQVSMSSRPINLALRKGAWPGPQKALKMWAFVSNEKL